MGEALPGQDLLQPIAIAGSSVETLRVRRWCVKRSECATSGVRSANSEVPGFERDTERSVVEGSDPNYADTCIELEEDMLKQAIVKR